MPGSRISAPKKVKKVRGNFEVVRRTSKACEILLITVVARKINHHYFQVYEQKVPIYMRTVVYKEAVCPYNKEKSCHSEILSTLKIKLVFAFLILI